MSEVPVETGTDGAQPAPRRTGFFHFDVIVSLCAIFISAVSLYTGIDNSRVQHKLLAASVWPFLGAVMSNNWDGGADVAIGVSNDGVGPARIRTFELFYRGRPLRNGVDLLQQCCGAALDEAGYRKQVREFSSSTVDETVLRAGEQDVVLKYFPGSTDKPVMDRLKREIANLGFRVCYCSVLDECWVGDLRTTRTTPVATCPPPVHRFDPPSRSAFRWKG